MLNGFKLKYFLLFFSFTICLSSIDTFSNTIDDVAKRKEIVKEYFFNNRKSSDFQTSFSKLREYYSFVDPYKGLNFYNEIVKNPNSLNTPHKKSLIYNAIALQYAKLGQYQIAAKYYFLSISASKEIPNQNQVALNYIDLGNLYYKLYQYDEAIHYYNNAIKILDSLISITKQEKKYNNDLKDRLTVANENIGLCLLNLKKYDSAIVYVKKNENVRLAPHQTVINKQYYFTTLGRLYFSAKKYDSAIFYSKKSLDFDFEKLLTNADIPEHKLFKSNAELILGQSYLKLNQTDLAFEYFNKALETRKYFKSANHLLTAYIIIIDFLLQENFLEEAKKFINEARKLSDKNPELTDQRYALLKLATVYYSKINNPSIAKKIQDTIIRYLDSITQRVSAENIKIARIDVELQNNLKTIEALNLEKHYKDQEIKNQKTIIFLFILIAFFFILLAAVIFYFYLQRQKLNKQLSAKNEELEKLNEKLSLAFKKTEEMNIELLASQYELKKINESLEIANKTKNTLFSIIAHDLKNGIGGIRSMNQMLVDEFYSYGLAELKEMIDLMNESSSNMYKLLENMLLWSSSQRGLIQPNKEINIPHYIVNSSISLYRQKAKEKNITISNLVPLDLSFVFDASLFDTIVRNLVYNAIKFSNDGGFISISAEIKDNEVLFCVEDNGVGMPQEKASKIFEMDTKKSTTGTKGEKGTGLGLMVCYDFVKMHNGRIWFESEVGKGTKAYFTFEYLTQQG